MPLYSANLPIQKNEIRRRTFNPSRISNLDLWLDAADENTLYDATSGGSPVRTDGSAVKRWEDKSGNSNHATEATAAPLLEVAEKNGLNALNFATSKKMDCVFSKTYTAQTSFVVAKYSTSASSYARLLSQKQSGANDYSGTGHYIQILRDATNNNVCSWKASGIRSTVSVSNNTFYIFRALHDSSKLNVKANTTTGTDYSTTLNFALDRLRIGDMILTDNLSDNAFWNSIICEVLLYSKALSTTESESVTNYLNSKWAIY